MRHDLSSAELTRLQAAIDLGRSSPPSDRSIEDIVAARRNSPKPREQAE